MSSRDESLPWREAVLWHLGHELPRRWKGMMETMRKHPAGWVARGGWMSMLVACLALGAAASTRAQVPPATLPALEAAPEDRILVQAWAEVETVLASPMVGLVQKIPTRVGQAFAKGDELIRFECTENEARAAIAQAELTAATENLDAKIRLKSLNAASDIEVTLGAAQVTKADAQLRLSQHQAQQCVIRAPFAGYVVRVLGKPYQTTTVGQPMLEIISAGTPKLRVSADSRFFPRVRIGTPLRVSIRETGLSYMAEVSLVNARIDPVNQTFEMEARIQGVAPGLLPGMSGSAAISGFPSVRVGTR
jgi:membrane fusion protein, multidrug efflux system